MSDDRRSRLIATARSWRLLVAGILVALSCAYLVPIERSLALFTSTNVNASNVSTGTLAAPVALLANVTAPTTVRLNWAASTSPFVTGYNIYRLSGAEPDYTLIATRGTATTFDDFGLPGTTVHTYYVEAISGDWTSAQSPTATAVTP